MAAVGGILAGAGSIISSIGPFLGSGKTDCKNKRQATVQAIKEYFTPADMERLGSYDPGRTGPDAETMAYFVHGEDDCKHKNVSAIHQDFLDDFERTLSQRSAGGANAASSSPDTDVSPDGGTSFWSGLGEGLSGAGQAFANTGSTSPTRASSATTQQRSSGGFLQSITPTAIFAGIAAVAVGFLAIFAINR